MKTKKQGIFSLTPRIGAAIFRNSHNSPNGHKKKQRHLTDDGYHGICPWGIDEIPQNPRYNKNQQKQSLIRQMNYKFNQSLKIQNLFKIKKMEFERNDKLKQLQELKGQSKTQSFKNQLFYQAQTPIKFKTIIITHNTQPHLNSQKQDKKQRKSTQLREIKLQKVKINGDNKQVAKINENHNKFNKSMSKMRIKTNKSENENNNKLLFYFETKNSINLLRRQQSIMKLRNLTGRKNTRFITDG